MRKLLLVLPVTAVLLAAGVLGLGLGRSVANAELPDSSLAATPVASTTPAGVSADDWTETGRKVPLAKSNYRRPDAPNPPGSRRKR